MSLIQLLKNIKYLYKNDLKKIKTLPIDLLIEQILYELPNINLVKPQILNHDETIDALLNSEKSLARFGDGEINIIKGLNIPFQEYHSVLAKRLKNILLNNNNNILVGINYDYYYPNIKTLFPIGADFYRYIVPDLRNYLSELINPNSIYCSATITQLYLCYKEYDFENYYKKIRQIWNNKNILILTCKEQLKNIEYNIFDNAYNIDYMFIPPQNAYSKYNEVLNYILKFDKSTLIILMAGPMAKVLVEDLTNNKYRALDLGHLMKDYDWYKKNIKRTDKKIAQFMLPDN